MLSLDRLPYASFTGETLTIFSRREGGKAARFGEIARASPTPDFG